jgi:hypothetical protein
MKAPTIQFSLVVPAALAVTSICLSLFLLRGGGQSLRPLPVAPVVNTAAGPVEAVLGPTSRLLAPPGRRQVEDLQVAAETPVAQSPIVRSQPDRTRAHTPAATRPAPKPPAAAPPPAPEPVQASADSLAINATPLHGHGKKLGHAKNKRHIFLLGKEEAPAKDGAEGHEIVKTKATKASPGKPEPKAKKAPPGKPEPKAEKASPGKPEPKGKKASAGKPQPKAVPVPEQDPAPARGRADDDHGGGGRGGGKK